MPFVSTGHLMSSKTSVGVFDLLILPLLDPRNDKFFHKHFGALYQAFWLAPLVGLSIWLNISWCSSIAARTYAIRVGRQAVSASPYTGLVAQVASSAYRVILIISYLILTFMLTYVPYLGATASFIYICWVNSYYCFEYAWISRGMTLSQRVKYEEERWAYYLAFGFPSAFLCMWASSLGNAAIFALIYPLMIIQAMHATPLPLSPHLLDSVGGSPAQPSSFIPVRMPIFAPVIVINDGIVNLLSVTGTSRAAKRTMGLRPISSEEGDLIDSPMTPSGSNSASVGGVGGGSGVSYGSPVGYAGYGYNAGGSMIPAGGGAGSMNFPSSGGMGGGNIRLRRKD
ncbi:hypothetical protein FRB96_005198 [Tulasnella sp. 330]|nr:hypothetical protein FRB96_005198 [Tulasnella sp. 330]KAG8884862.1 hypothetical protein FRB97_003069 [Tulasnella sp. 331]KAG8890120.1 hypothetical protein FRB98_000848 [Tulasnella sp. 332]